MDPLFNLPNPLPLVFFREHFRIQNALSQVWNRMVAFAHDYDTTVRHSLAVRSSENVGEGFLLRKEILLNNDLDSMRSTLRTLLIDFPWRK